MKWNHPNHLAGFLAELAEVLCVERSERWYGKIKYWNAAIALRRAAQRVWTKSGRQRLAARLGRVLGRPVTNSGHMAHGIEGSDEYEEYQRELEHAGWLPNTQRHLVTSASAILIGQQQQEKEFTTSTIGSIRLAGLGDVIDKIELKWRIRDWLAATAVTNVAPNIRLAAAAAWEASHRSLARAIVLEAAMGARCGR